MQDITNLTIAFPNWFYGILTIGILAFVFYLGALHFQIKKICKEHPKIQQSLIRISEILLQKKMTKDSVYAASASPVQLTEEGKKAIQESKFQEFYNANKDTLIERVKKKNPKTIADLEEACKSVMLPIEDTLPSFDLLKRFAYNKGEAISNILFAGAIALRDILQKELNLKE
jgi:hypothetical protein